MVTSASVVLSITRANSTHASKLPMTHNAGMPLVLQGTMTEPAVFQNV